MYAEKEQKRWDESKVSRGSTLPYHKPVANKVKPNILFLSGICNDHADGSGRAKTAKSERQFDKAVVFQIVSTSRQRPSSQGIRAFSRGLQANVAGISRTESRRFG